MKNVIIASALLAVSSLACAADAVSFQVCTESSTHADFLIEDFGDAFAVYQVNRVAQGTVMAEFPVVHVEVDPGMNPNALVGGDEDANYTIARDSNEYWIDFPSMNKLTFNFANCKPAPAALSEVVRTSLNAAARPSK